MSPLLHPSDRSVAVLPLHVHGLYHHSNAQFEVNGHPSFVAVPSLLCAAHSDVTVLPTYAATNEDAVAVDSDTTDASHRPPLLIALTGYRLLNLTTILSVGTAKAVLVARGYSTEPTTLEWVLDVLLTLV